MRETALWRLLYETAARASEVLSLDVGDVDLDNRRAVVRSKGGDVEVLHFQTGAARLLPRLIGGRIDSVASRLRATSRRTIQRQCRRAPNHAGMPSSQQQSSGARAPPPLR